MIRFIQDRAAPWQVAFALTTFAVFSIFLLAGPYAALDELRDCPCEDEAQLETRLAYSPRDAHLYIENLGSKGRRLQQEALEADLFYPPVYGPALAFTLSVALWRATRRRGALLAGLVVPLVAGAIDYVEDFSLLALLSMSPRQSDALAVLASVATTLKLVLVALSMAAVPFSLVAWAISSFRRRGASR